MKYILRLLLISLIAMSWTAHAAEDASVINGGQTNYQNPNAQQGVQGNLIGGIDSGAANWSVDSDIMFTMLRKTFGDMVYQVRTLAWPGANDNQQAGTQATILTTLMTVLTNITLFIGAILLGYTMFTGLINTAHDGELLGRRWSSVWIPMRTFVGIALITPTSVYGGLALIQVLVLIIAMFGAGIANVLWAITVGLIMQQPVSGVDPGEEAFTLVHSMFQARICGELYNQHLGTNNATQLVVSPPHTDTFLGFSVGTTETSVQVSVGPDGKCGQMEIRTDINGTPIMQNNNYMLQTEKAIANRTLGMLQGIWNDQAFQQAAVDVMNNNYDVKTSYTGTNDPAYNAFAQIPIKATNYLLGYSNTFNNANIPLNNVSSPLYTQSMTAMQNKFAQHGATGGFVMAGSYYYEMLGLQNALINQTEAVFSKGFTPPAKESGWCLFGSCIGGEDEPNDLHWDGFGDLFAHRMQKADLYFSKTLATNTTKAALTTVAQDQEGAFDQYFAGTAAKISKFMVDSVRKVATGNGNNNPDPLMEMKTLGNIIINSLVGGSVAAGVGSYAWKKVNLLGKLKNQVLKDTVNEVGVFMGTLIAAMAFGLFTLGILYAWIVPAMPFILWISAVLGYLINVVENVISAPIMGIMHAHPDGEGILGSKTGPGYAIITNLTLKPMGMVLGLIAGMVLFRVIAWVVNFLLWDTMTLMTKETFNIGASFGFLLIYAIIMLGLAYRCFSLIFEVPRFLLAMVGSSDQRDTGEREMLTAAAGGAYGAGNATTNALSGAKKATSQLARANRLKRTQQRKDLEGG